MTHNPNLSQLVGQHVFAEYTYRDRTTVVKGLVLELKRGRLKLELVGNGAEFDGKTIVAIVPELQIEGGEVRTA